MGLVKGYVRPVGSQFELGIAAPEGVATDTLARVVISNFETIGNPPLPVFRLTRRMMTYNESSTVLPGGGVLTTPITIGQFEILRVAAGFEEGAVELGVPHYFLPEQIDFRNISLVTPLEPADPTMPQTVVIDREEATEGNGLYEVAVTDSDGAVALADEDVFFGPVYASISSPPVFDAGTPIDIIITTFNVGVEITGISLTANGTELLDATQMQMFTNVSASDNTLTTLTVSYQPTDSTQLVLTVQTPGAPDEREILQVEPNNTPPSISLAGPDTGVIRDNITITATVMDNDFGGGQILWYVDGVRTQTTTNTTFTYTRASAGTSMINALAVDALGQLSPVSNTITTTWA